MQVSTEVSEESETVSVTMTSPISAHVKLVRDAEKDRFPPVLPALRSTARMEALPLASNCNVKSPTQLATAILSFPVFERLKPNFEVTTLSVVLFSSSYSIDLILKISEKSDTSIVLVSISFNVVTSLGDVSSNVN